MQDTVKAIHNLLVAKGWKIAVAESLTAGNIQAALASVSGASKVFAGGVTAYNIDQKVNLLGVNRKHAQECDCVSPWVASQMATGVSKMFGAEVTLGITGYAELPGEGTPYAFYEIQTRHPDSDRIEKTASIVYMDECNRAQAQQQATEMMLQRVLAHLQGPI